jgi:flagellar hook assembly protein FlgD
VLSSYPNPANPSATVVYTVRRAGQRVRVSVYNTLGQEVTRLVDGARPVGIHHARWDGRTDGGDPVTSGVYIVRVVTEDGARTRRLTLLR